MREILFRGKDIRDEWVYGDLWHNPYGERKICIVSPINDQGTTGGNEVIPETIGQYTGLTDKNGKKIFEGDILSERPPMNETSYIGYVAYDDESAVYRFMIKNDTNYNGVLLGSYSLSYTVIGNAFSNPELLRSDCE